MAFGILGTTSNACYSKHKTKSKEIKLYIDGKKVNFTKDLGYPFIDDNSRTQVPFRAFSEACNFKVSWDGKKRVGYAKKCQVTFDIPVGCSFIKKNGKRIHSDTQNVIFQDRIYIPLRIVLESFGYKVTWDGDNRAIYVTSEDQVDVEEPVDDDDVEEPVVTSSSALRGVHIGDDVTSVTQSLGQPNRMDKSRYGFDWYIYNSDYKKYLQIGVEDDKVVALYTNASYWALDDTVRYGVASNTVKNSLGIKKTNNNQLKITKNDYDYTFYIDTLDHQKVVGVSIMAQSAKRNDYENKSAEALIASYEKQVFDLTNVERVNKGLQPFEWNEAVAVLARQHSKDMSDKNYFSHTNLQGEAPWDRAKKANIKYSYFGENIAMGQWDAIQVVSGWMNSSGHRNNILKEKYTGLGVGVWFNEKNVPHYTQNFIR